MSLNDSQPGKPPHIVSGNGDPQGPLRKGPWGEVQAFDHDEQRWVVIRAGRPPLTSARMAPMPQRRRAA